MHELLLILAPAAATQAFGGVFREHNGSAIGPQYVPKQLEDPVQCE
jgi:hypothetical protein